MSVFYANKENFSEVTSSQKTVLIDFYADWCGPCRLVAPVIDALAAENPQYLVVKINVDNEPELAHKFGIVSIPTLIVMKNGAVVRQEAGARSKAQILAMLEG